ncbi:MAG TPA: hypothetical protein VFJ43_10005, partial [Bacteroidia bacterium]|nr:hypothetical protein [Bacteroidia bacterium]
TPCVLDCFQEEKLSGIMQQLKSHHVPGGEWLFVDFNIPEKGSRTLGTFSAFKIRAMYFFFNVICGLGVKQLPDFKKEFDKLNLEKKAEKYFLSGLMVGRIYE